VAAGHAGSQHADLAHTVLGEERRLDWQEALKVRLGGPLPVMNLLTGPGLFRTFGAPHGAGPGEIAGEYGNTRARRSSKRARPYIWRLIILSRLIWPST